MGSSPDIPARSCPPDSDPASLTERQTEVAKLIACGWTNKEIARRMGLGLKTIDAHTTGALQTLKLRNRVELAVWACKRGWV